MRFDTFRSVHRKNGPLAERHPGLRSLAYKQERPHGETKLRIHGGRLDALWGEESMPFHYCRG